MPLIPNSRLLNNSITTNADGNSAIRVVITNPSPEDIPGPTNITISNDEVDTLSPAGTIVGSLTAIGGIGPYTFLITDDPDDKFILTGGNVIELDNSVDYDTDTDHSLTIEVTDSNSKIFTKSFVITVLEQEAFTSNYQLDFDGTNDYCNLFRPPNLLYDFTSTFSISMWLTNDAGTARGILGNGSSGVGWWAVIDSSQRIEFHMQGATSNLYVRSVGNIGTGTRAHVVITKTTTFGTSAFQMYIDGLPTVTQSITNTVAGGDCLNSADVMIGRAGVTGTTYWDGQIDDILFFNTVLNGFQVIDLYNYDSGLGYGSPSDVYETDFSNLLVHGYLMGDPEGTSTFPIIEDIEGGYNIDMENMNSANIVASAP